MKYIDYETKEAIIEAVKAGNQGIIKHRDERFDLVYKRFGDVDKELYTLGARLRETQKDTEIIPDILKMLAEHGLDIAELKERFKSLA